MEILLIPDKIKEIINIMNLSSAIKLHPIQLTSRESQLYALMTTITTNNNMCSKDGVTLTSILVSNKNLQAAEFITYSRTTTTNSHREIVRCINISSSSLNIMAAHWP